MSRDVSEHAAHTYAVRGPRAGHCTHCGITLVMARVFPRCLPHGWPGDAETMRIYERALAAGRASDAPVQLALI